ncbi:MAG TPA: hypothetical protein VKQ08_01650, partial [Cyclobacteriaceae bacterium]|nr:hypothetical protein [Cyclobacteriaceae bacterium]
RTKVLTGNDNFMKPQNEIKQQAMSAITGVKSVVGQVGLAKITLGAAVYAAHIRQMDRQRPQPPRQVLRDAIGREI